MFRSRPVTAVSSTPIAVISDTQPPIYVSTPIRPKSPSELAIDSHGVLCQANELKFSNDLKVRHLEPIQCGAMSTVQLIPIEPDLQASGVNCSTFHEPYNLCQFHSEVYLSLRKIEPCSRKYFHYAYPKSRGKDGLWDTHLSSNEA